MITREKLNNELNDILEVYRFRDFCPNGLQVEGCEKINNLVSGVTACRELLEKAAALNADAVLVHHGYFWRNENPCITGHRLKRIKLLLQNNINLFAYHLPLDSHPVLGNNAQLAKLLEFETEGRFGEDDIGWVGRVSDKLAQTVGDLAQLVALRLGREPTVIGDLSLPLDKIAWCSGAAQSMMPDAVLAGASVYISGEISEQTVHLARETGVAYLACGHHATERYGVRALGDFIAEKFNIRHWFVEVENPA